MNKGYVHHIEIERSLRGSSQVQIKLKANNNDFINIISCDLTPFQQGL